MTRYVYVDGQFVPHALAMVHVEDRGYQFADAAYEVMAVLGGRVLDCEAHLDRLTNSLDQLRISAPRSKGAMERIIEEMIRRNRVRQGTIYIQVSRGQAPRDHAFPSSPIEPVLVMTTKSFGVEGLRKRQRGGVAVTTTPEIRWRRCDIKSVSLLGNVLAKEEARAAGSYEAWFVDEAGNVTEGSSSNAWLVRGGRLITRQLDEGILPGITRSTVTRLAGELQITVEERPFTPAEALSADEAFITSTSCFVTPVVRIDGAQVALGKPGPVTLRLMEAFSEDIGRRLGVDWPASVD